MLRLNPRLAEGILVSHPDPLTDERFMKMALRLARKAFSLGEVPVGAVVVVDGKVVGRGYNQSIARSDPTAHAEVLALRQAARRVGNYRLTSATIYCTLEPCAMCAGSMVWARVQRLVYGAKDPKAGAVDSNLRLFESESVNHRVEVVSGVGEAQSVKLLQEFFRLRRQPGSGQLKHRPMMRRGTEVVITGPPRKRLGG